MGRQSTLLLRNSSNYKIIFNQKRNSGRRAKWKLPYVNMDFLVSVRKARQSRKTWFEFVNKIHKTHDRKMTIVPEFVGLKMAIHNGMMYVHILITPEMVNHKLGEFAHTRKVKHYLSGLETS